MPTKKLSDLDKAKKNALRALDKLGTHLVKLETMKAADKKVSPLLDKAQGALSELSSAMENLVDEFQNEQPYEEQF